MLRSLVAFAALANGRLRRPAVRRKLEEACWRRSHAHCRRWRRGHAPGRQTELQLEAVTSAGVILPETGQFLLLCSLQLWQQLQRCRQTRASFFLKRILLPFYVNSSPWGSEQSQTSARVKKLTAALCCQAIRQLTPNGIETIVTR